jgi:putative ABC transport system permease protein
METVGQISRFALVVLIVVVAIGSLVVLTTMLGAVAERRQEIGLFRALGYRQRHVMEIVLGEAAVMTLAGGALGWLVGMGMAVLLTPRLVGVSAPVLWDLRLALATTGGSLLVGVAASLYPAVHAARLDPMTALRSL